MAVILPNIPRIYTALAESLACLLIVIELPKNQRTKNWIIYSILGTFGQVFLQWLVGYWSTTFWILGMAINIGWMFLILYLCEKVTLNLKIYHLSKSFILAEFWASLSWQLYCYTLLKSPFGIIAEAIFLIITYAILFTIFFFWNRGKKYQYALENISVQETKSTVITAIIIFTVSNAGFMFYNTDFTLGDTVTVFMMRTFIDLCGVLLIFLEESQRYETALSKDLSSMNNMFNSQYEQYKAYRENSQLVNQRFHDLKHQLDIIELEPDPHKRTEYIQSIRNDIKQFKSDVKTGNPIADVILTRKNAYCIRNNITFTCIVDGKLLDFINTMDLCSLLGNSLDNATESSIKIKNKEKRLINLRIKQKAEFVVFSLENYTETQQNITDNNLKTTKKDKENHGYGLKSIKYIADKYNGAMAISTKNNWFTLRILFPLNSLH